MFLRLLLPLLLLAGAAHAQPTGPSPAFPHPDGTNCAASNAARGTDEEGNAQDCFAISAVGGAIVAEEDDVTVETLATGVDFLGADFDLNAAPAGEVNIAISANISRTTHSHTGGGEAACRHVFTTETAGDTVFCGRAFGTITLDALNCTALGGVTPVVQVVEVVECTAAGASCSGSGGTISAAAVEFNYEDTTFIDKTIDNNDYWGFRLVSYTTRADYLNCEVEFTQTNATTGCHHTFTTESAGDVIMCGKVDGDLILDNLSCAATGGTTPAAQIARVVECTSNGATCVDSRGSITAAAVETNYEDAAFTNRSVDENDWWGIELLSFTTRADYLGCKVEYSQTSPSTECRHVFTTETASDVILCGKAKGAVTLANLNCTAIGATTPVAQVINVVECNSAGGACVSSGGTITAAALETDYEDDVFTDNAIDDNDWWGIQLASVTTKADYLKCQVEFDTL